MSNATIELPANLKLVSGSIGDRASNTACIMSAVAWIAGLSNTDAPECACPVIRRLSIRLNDGAWWSNDDERTAELLPLAKKIVGTASTPAVEIARAKAAAEWALTFAAPFALDAAAGVVPEPHKTKLTEMAGRMREKADRRLAIEAKAIAKEAQKAVAAYAVAAYAAAAYAADDAAAYAADAADAYAADAADAAAAGVAYAAAYAADAAAYAADAAARRLRRLAAKKPLRDALKELIGRLIEIKA